MNAVGDCCVDRYVDEAVAFPGGSCANAAVFASRLGADSAYMGVIGSDDAGALIRDALLAESVDLTHVISADEPTSTTDIRVADGDRLFVGHVPARTAIHIDAAARQRLSRSDWIHTGHSSGTESLLPELAALAPIIFDFSHRGLDYADALLPHVSVAAFSREEADDEECAALLHEATARGPRIAVVTRGAGGVVALMNGALHAHPAARVEVVDTTGAGDAFQTALMVGLHSGEDVDDVLRASTSFAAAVCGHRGAFGHETSTRGKAV
jgi:fructoselysine 6-kinase